MLIDIILILSYISLASVLLITLWAVWRTLRAATRQTGYVHGIPTRKIALGLSATVTALLVLTFLLGGTNTLHINGEQYTDVFVLKSSDMLISTSIILIVAAAACAIFSFYSETKQIDKDNNIFIDIFTKGFATKSRKKHFATKTN